VSQENVRLIRAMLDAWADGRELDPAIYFDPAVEFIAGRSDIEGPFRGHGGIRRFIEETHENYDKFEPHVDLRDLGNQVLAWGFVRLRGVRGGVELDIPAGDVFDFRDGKIVRWQSYGSKDEALKAVGGER
jgi:ketosteroid isomerase-like protein